jgi:hypothetical protein
MKSKQLLVSSAVILGSLLLAGTAFAAEQGPRDGGMPGRGPIQGFMMRDGHASTTLGIVGIVGSVNGNTLTVNSMARKMGPAKTISTTTYTVDASGAAVFKNATTSTVSAIAVGDVVMVQGTINGTNVVAKRIVDGATRPGMMGRDDKEDKRLRNASSTPRGMMGLPLGNGQPVIAGNVTAISGNSITVTNKGGVTYTVDASSAKVSKHDVTSATITDVVVGDSVVIQGTFNGTSVTASIVVDQGTRPALETNSGKGQGDNQGEHQGFGAAVGGFFSHLFGF